RHPLSPGGWGDGLRCIASRAHTPPRLGEGGGLRCIAPASFAHTAPRPRPPSPEYRGEGRRGAGPSLPPAGALAHGAAAAPARALRRIVLPMPRALAVG